MSEKELKLQNELLQKQNKELKAENRKQREQIEELRFQPNNMQAITIANRGRN